MEVLLQCVRRNSATLQKFKVHSACLETDLHAAHFWAALASCPRLTHFDSPGCLDPDMSADMYNALLADVVASCPLLTDVDLACNHGKRIPSGRVSVPQWCRADGQDRTISPETVAAFLARGTHSAGCVVSFILFGLP